MPKLGQSIELSALMQISFNKAADIGYEFYTSEHFLLSVANSKNGKILLSECGCDIDGIKNDLKKYIDENIEILPKLSDLPKKDEFSEDIIDDSFEENSGPLISAVFSSVCDRANLHAQMADKKAIDIFDMIIALYEADPKKIFASYVLRKNGLEEFALKSVIAETRRSNQEDKESTSNNEENSSQTNYGDVLKKFTTNLTEQAKNGKLDEIIGREEELDRTIQILCRRTKDNPVHVGEAGVGKTAIAEGLAQKIVKGDVPTRLKDYEIFSIDMATLVAGTKFRGDFEARLKKIIDALLKKQKAILYIDELHTIVGAGASGSGNLDVSNILKPVLANGSVRVMGATTYDEYAKSIEKNRALARRFQKVDVPEPSKEDTIKILKGICGKYEAYHNVSYPLKTLVSAVDLSVQYLPERHLPDKAIDIIDEAGVYVSLQNEKRTKKLSKPTVTESIIKKVTAKMAKVPLESVKEDEKAKLKALESTLKSQVFGQDEAIEAVALAVKKSRAGFRNLDKPEASFLFVGPTGVGKTELTKVLSETLNENLLRFDMSEYQESYSVSRLIGSAPGYVGYDEGGQLTEAVRRNPHSIILFDEIEKAHEDIYNILLQVLDYGTLTDNQGRKADFRNCIIILTSNAGARDMEKGLVGFDSGFNSKKNDSAALKEAVSKAFSPEFRNRLDSIITFHHLEENVTFNIAQKAVNKIADRLLTQKVKLEATTSSIEFISKKGYSKEFGARNISRTAENLIATPLVDEVLFGKLSNGGFVEVDLNEEKDELTFSFKK